MSNWQAPDDRPGPTGSRPPDVSKADAGPGASHPGSVPGAWSTGGDGWGAGPSPSWGPAPAPRPGIVPLRPLSLGDIWDGAFRAFRANPKVVVGMSAVVVVVSQLVSLAGTYAFTMDMAGIFSRMETDPSSFAAFDDVTGLLTRSLPLMALSVLVQTVSILVLNGLLIVAVSRAVLGRVASVGEVWREVRPRILALVGLSLVVSLVPFLVGLITLAPGIGVLALGSDSDLGLGLGIALVVLGLGGWLVLAAWLTVRWGLAAPALLLERLGVGAALRRSVGLIKGSFWRVLGILLLTAVVVYFVVIAVSTPFSILGTAVTALGSDGGDLPSGGAFFAQQALGALGSIIGSLLALPFLASVTALVYIDLRMRREGLDVELHRAASGGGER